MKYSRPYSQVVVKMANLVFHRVVKRRTGNKRCKMHAHVLHDYIIPHSTIFAVVVA